MLHFSKRCRLAAATTVLLAAATCAHATPAVTDPDIIKTEFGIFEDDGTDQLGFGATDEIPLAAGQSYGWLIQARTTKKTLAVREEVLLPQDEAPAADAQDGEVALTPNRELLHSLNERRVPVSDGVIFGVRRVRADDKPGRYRMKVYVERKLVASFDYYLLAALPAVRKEDAGTTAAVPGKPPAGATRKGRKKQAAPG